MRDGERPTCVYVDAHANRGLRTVGASLMTSQDVPTV